MESPAPPPSSPQSLERLSRPLQWGLLVTLSLICAVVLEFMDIPAALLLGPMLAAIICGTAGATIRLPTLAFTVAQAAVGCLIAASLTTAIFASLLERWPLFVGVAIATLVASSFLGWFISRLKILPGTTAVWGSAPGGATAMVLMADAFGADARLVAFMQYFRVILVSLTAALIARLLGGEEHLPAPEPVWFPAIDWPAFGTMLAVMVFGAAAGRLLRLPSPYFMGAVVLGAVVHLGFGLPLQLPEWLLALSYAAIGWSIGLNFTRGILAHAFRALPQIAGSTLALMAFCGGLAFLLSYELGIDPLTAYLATSPGGLDSIAIIAAATDDVDISFVMALQAARLVIVLAVGPPLVKLVSRWIRE